MALLHQCAQPKVQRAAIAQPGKCVRQRLFFGGRLGPVQAQVQVAQLIHHGRFRLNQIEHFNGQIGDRKIGHRQTIAAHRLIHPNSKRQVDQQAPVHRRLGKAAQDKGRIAVQRQVKPRADARPQFGKACVLRWTAQGKDLTHRLANRDLIGHQFVQGGPDRPDQALPVQPQVHWHQPIKRGAIQRQRHCRQASEHRHGAACPTRSNCRPVEWH
ncbi:MAG: hypothetical protein ACO22Z_13495 [Paracoccaceae bacterium]